MNFANVILPLQLPKELTYRIPARLRGSVRVGMRVSVPLGKSKSYTGIVCKITDNADDTLEYRDITEVLDTEPVANELQLRLWQWMADYYMCSLGDMYRCAIPAGLKPDTLHEGYKPKTETHISLTDEYLTESALQKALDGLRRAPMQQKLLMNFVYLATQDWQTFNSIPRHELLTAQQGCSNALRGLIDKGILREDKVCISRIEPQGYEDTKTASDSVVLSEAQQQACSSIREQWTEHDVVLLHGVTSSGKTEIYTQLILDAINGGDSSQVLFLVPEIALTAQLMMRMKRVLGDKLGIYHSGFSDAERVEIYRKQLSDNPYRVVMGARSAMFLPFQNLRLVIVDEEHEPSYKQQSPAPRYHARNSAIMLAGLAGAKTLLGSATPSVESYYNAQCGKYGLVSITERYGNVSLPEIEIVDIRECRHKKMFDGPFMDPLTDKIRAANKAGEQTILFQNRRGLAHYISCEDCGASPSCPNCDVSLTPHRHHGRQYLSCHYCGYSTPMPETCPSCNSTKISTSGLGTERVEEDAGKLFPDIRIARLDTDTTRTKNSHQRIIKAFAEHQYDMLVGTQMVSKGLDFGHVSLVAVLNADSLLTLPDYRATERAYQLLEQVSGRAGRREKTGMVVIQTYNPGLPVINWVREHDYNAFYRYTIAERQLLRYPPFVRMYNVVLRHANGDILRGAAEYVRVILAQNLGNCVSDVIDPLVGRVQNLYYKHIVLKMDLSHSLKHTRQIISFAINQMSAQVRFHAVQTYIDVDP